MQQSRDDESLNKNTKAGFNRAMFHLSNSAMVERACSGNGGYYMYVESGSHCNLTEHRGRESHKTVEYSCRVPCITLDSPFPVAPREALHKYTSVIDFKS